MTGESFVNVYGITTLLNNYDKGYTFDTEAHCGRIDTSDPIPLRDYSCNIRKKEDFTCEIILP